MSARAIARRRPRGLAGVLELGVLILLIAGILLPIFWMVSTSLKPTDETFAVPPKILFSPTLEHYTAVFEDTEVPRALLNSLIVATCSTVLAVLLGTPAAYVLARFSFRGRQQLWFWIISNRFITPIVLAVPFFLVARTLGLVDNVLALILIYLTFNLPLTIWLCVDQFRAISPEMEEAALVDGATLARTFRSIALPVAAPSVAVAAILCFIFSWNEFLFALVLTRDSAQTAPVAAANFMTGFGVRWGPMMATGTLIILPVLVFAAIVSRRLVSGLTVGSIK